MDVCELFNRQVTFDCLLDYLKNRADSDNRYDFRIKKAREIFDETLRGLKSLIERDRYYIVEDLREIIEASGYDTSKLSEIQVGQLIARFNGVVHTLDELAKNPKQVYRKRGELFDLEETCNMMGDVYRMKQMFVPQNN